MYRPLFLLPNNERVDPYTVFAVRWHPASEDHKPRVNIHYGLYQSLHGYESIISIPYDTDEQAKAMCYELGNQIESLRAKEGLYEKFRDASKAFDDAFMSFDNEKFDPAVFEKLLAAHRLYTTPMYGSRG